MADIHLGAASDQALKKLEVETLDRAVKICDEEEVDFIIISGDLFHVNIPDLGVVRDSVKVLMKFVATGRKIYVVYGSHDFSPNSTSIIDILEEAGVLIRVGKPQVFEGKLRPSVVRDSRSGALLTGISGRRASLERQAFLDLDREYLASLEGFKIFVFHTGIEEVRKEGERYEGIPSTDLPRGFDYYAGGHLHRRIEITKGMNLVFPGPLFAGWGADMEATVRGERRGMYIVETDGGLKTRFVDMTPLDGVFKEFPATGLSPQALNGRLMAFAEEADVRGKLVVVKVFGELANGRTSEVDFNGFREALARRGAVYLHLSRGQLRSREIAAITVGGGEPGEIEEKVFAELAGTVKAKNDLLREGSAKIARDLLTQLRVPKREGETETDYESRAMEAAVRVLGIGKLLEGK
jgi:DNA repair exonuclease SbcCD nuclease subunit